jgi:hypothetical protein
VPRYFVLAKGTKALPYAGNFPWPYEVGVSFDPVSRPVSLMVGVGQDRPGTLLTCAEALQPHWKESFVNAGGEWLLLFFEDALEGAQLDEKQILQLAAAKLGHAPESYEVQQAS